MRVLNHHAYFGKVILFYAVRRNFGENPDLHLERKCPLCTIEKQTSVLGQELTANSN